MSFLYIIALAKPKSVKVIQSPITVLTIETKPKSDFSKNLVKIMRRANCDNTVTTVDILVQSPPFIATDLSVDNIFITLLNNYYFHLLIIVFIGEERK